MRKNSVAFTLSLRSLISHHLRQGYRHHVQSELTCPAQIDFGDRDHRPNRVQTLHLMFHSLDDRLRKTWLMEWMSSMVATQSVPPLRVPTAVQESGFRSDLPAQRLSLSFPSAVNKAESVYRRLNQIQYCSRCSTIKLQLEKIFVKTFESTTLRSHLPQWASLSTRTLPMIEKACTRIASRELLCTKWDLCRRLRDRSQSLPRSFSMAQRNRLSEGMKSLVVLWMKIGWQSFRLFSRKRTDFVKSTRISENVRQMHPLVMLTRLC